MRGSHSRRPALVALAAAGALALITGEVPRTFAEAPPAAGPAESETGAGEAESAEAERRAAERERLFRALARAQTEAEARRVTREIWAYWFDPPDAEPGALMDRAIARVRRRDHAGAIRILDALVILAPDWAEAWNQRATVRFFARQL